MTLTSIPTAANQRHEEGRGGSASAWASTHPERSTLDAELVDLLEFPRWLMRARLPLAQDCQRATVFDIGSVTCRRCGYRPECEWLHDWGDANEALARSRLATLVAVEVAILDAEQMVSLSHIKAVCSCRVCRWLRKAWDVTRRGRSRLRDSRARSRPLVAERTSFVSLAAKNEHAPTFQDEHPARTPRRRK